MTFFTEYTPEKSLDNDFDDAPTKSNWEEEFVEKALAIIPTGRKVAMFLKLTFLEGQKRKKMFQKYPPKTIYVYSSRRKCAINGDFDSIGSSASAYAWFVWEKGYQADPIIKWLD